MMVPPGQGAATAPEPRPGPPLARHVNHSLSPAKNPCSRWPCESTSGVRRPRHCGAKPPEWTSARGWAWPQGSWLPSQPRVSCLRTGQCQWSGTFLSRLSSCTSVLPSHQPTGCDPRAQSLLCLAPGGLPHHPAMLRHCPEPWPRDRRRRAGGAVWGRGQ